MITGLRMFNGEEYSFGTQMQELDCFCCGYCCVGYNPRVNDEEIAIMARYLKIGPDEFKSRYIQETLVGSLVRQTETGCVFLSTDKDSAKAYCGIHPARPTSCRDWIPSLWRRECCEGLAILQKSDSLLKINQVYENDHQREKFCASLRQNSKR
ncbi:MAG: YkgJ family cysteine cluster protein [Dehalococcoidales bacterium]